MWNHAPVLHKSQTKGQEIHICCHKWSVFGNANSMEHEKSWLREEDCIGGDEKDKEKIRDWIWELWSYLKHSYSSQMFSSSTFGQSLLLCCLHAVATLTVVYLVYFFIYIIFYFLYVLHVYICICLYDLKCNFYLYKCIYTVYIHTYIYIYIYTTHTHTHIYITFLYLVIIFIYLVIIKNIKM